MNKHQIKIQKFDNFDDKNDVICKHFYNFAPFNKLKSSFGIRKLRLPKGQGFEGDMEMDLPASGVSEVKGATFFKQFARDTNRTAYRILILTGENKGYINEMYCVMPTFAWLYRLEFNSCPQSLMYKKDDMDAVILTSVDKMIYWRGTLNPVTIENTPIITSMCINEGIIFCTILDPAHKIWYANDLDAAKIGDVTKNSNYISLNDDLGDAKKIISFNEDVYVFREYGISKIKYVQNEITVSQIYYSNTKILHNTVSICGNYVIFATKEGLYTFNGYKVNKLDINIDYLLTKIDENSCAGSLGDNYYLALNIDFADNQTLHCESEEYKNNAILILDIEDNTYQIIRGVDVNGFTPIRADNYESMLLTFNGQDKDKLGQICDTSVCFDEGLTKGWISEEIVPDDKIKMFTKLSIFSTPNVVIKLNHDSGSTTFQTSQNGLNEFNFKIYSKTLTIEILSNAEAVDVSHLVLDYFDE